MKAVVMPLLGAPPVNQPYHYLAGNAGVLPRTILTMVVAAGFGEETVFRGFLFERLGRLFGTSARAKVAIVLLTSALFAAGHYANMGWPGVEQASITGLAFGTIFTFTGELPLLMIAHAAFDVTAVWMIYSGVETKVAHFVFR
jgi:membrane protease YdiL (CAAX protease family)